jgi:hypothetical protein
MDTPYGLIGAAPIRLLRSRLLLPTETGRTNKLRTVHEPRRPNGPAKHLRQTDLLQRHPKTADQRQPNDIDTTPRSTVCVAPEPRFRPTSKQ